MRGERGKEAVVSGGRKIEGSERAAVDGNDERALNAVEHRIFYRGLPGPVLQ
jgi:hypothetical protein